MDLLLAVVLLLVGFVLLIKGADVFVDGSSSIAKKIGIPSIIVGLTIVAIGTSLPEAAVSISAAMKGSNAIAVSNVIGSNVFNLLMVLGLISIVKATKVSKDVLKRDFPYCILVTLIFVLFAGDVVLKGNLNASDLVKAANADKVAGTLGRPEGIGLLICFAVFIVVAVIAALKSIKKDGAKDKDEDNGKKISIPLSIVFIIIGIAAITFGGDLVVDNAKKIAMTFGMSETLVGLTIVAVGTSLPELVTSIVAVLKGEDDMAVGNCVGSNISNICFVIGSSSAIHPIAVSAISLVDLVICLLITAMVYIFSVTGKKIGRLEGIACVLVYFSYMAYTIIR